MKKVATVTWFAMVPNLLNYRQWQVKIEVEQKLPPVVRHRYTPGCGCNYDVENYVDYIKHDSGDVEIRPCRHMEV